MNCEYKYGGLTYKSHSEFVNDIEKYEWYKLESPKELDVIFSKVTRLLEQVNKIKNLKVTYTPRLDTSIESFYREENRIAEGFTILDFIDHPVSILPDGTTLGTPMNKEDYINNLVDQLIRNGTFTEDNRADAEAYVKNIVDNWAIVLKDAFELHNVFTGGSFRSNSDADFLSQNHFPSKLESLILKKKLYTELHNKWMNEKGKYSESEAFTSVNLKGKIKGLDKDMYGHIDWLYIGKDGTLHAYVFKVTSMNPSDWSEAKWTKYRYQMSFLRQLLAANGVNVKNIDLNIIPVLLMYNSDYSLITNVIVHPTKNMSRHAKEGRSNIYALSKYDRITRYFLEDNSIPKHISSSVVDTTEKIYRVLFPHQNITREGALLTAREWIAVAPSTDSLGTSPLVIRESEDNEYAYDVIINGKVHKVKSKKPKTRNKEIIDLVEANIRELNQLDNKGYITLIIKDAVKESYTKGFPTFGSTLGISSMAVNLEKALGKYLAYTGDNKQYEWELLENLVDDNVLIFKNKEGVIDIISLTPFSLNGKAKFDLGNGVLGTFKTNIQYNGLFGDYGNIELVRTMLLLNEMLPELGNVTLGSIGAISTTGIGSFRSHLLSDFNKKYFGAIYDMLLELGDDVKIEDNFKSALFENPVDLILEEFAEILGNRTSVEGTPFQEFGIHELDSNEALDVLIGRLFDIQQKILSIHPEFANGALLLQVINKKNTKTLDVELAKIYELVTRAYLSLTNQQVTYEHEFDAMDRLMFTAATVSDANVRMVVNNLLITHDTISSEFLGIYDSDIRPVFDTFYKEHGYGAGLNSTLGNQASQFNNCFEKDNEGHNLLIFKNPYKHKGDTNYLQEHERIMLKKVLFLIANTTRNHNFYIGLHKVTSENDPLLEKYIEEHEEYLWVPLCRASKATSRLSGAAMVARMKNFWKKIVRSSESFDEFVNGVSTWEREAMGTDEQSIYEMTLKNPFHRSVLTGKDEKDAASKKEIVLNQRLKMIEEYGAGFFETNIENILIEYVAKHISTTQFNKLLVASKAMLVLLYLKGEPSNNMSVVNKEMKYIEDYLKINVFNTSIMSKTELKIIGTISPIKHVVTNVLLGFNFIGGLRDTFEGIQQNFLRSLIKLNTNISPSSVAKAYAYVSLKSSANTMAPNLLSKLCLKYRISNTDVGRISERAKTGREGILNIETLAYSTLRGPDFLNRMTLFVARCMEDGVFGAFSLDDNGNLVYNWREDERFKAYAMNSTDEIEYNKARSLYYSAIRQYNLDHPELETKLSYDDDLPDPYSNLLVMSIRGVGDNIYGSYDKSKKAMLENLSVGMSFGMFTTWMNGIVNNYFMKPQENNVSRLELRLAVNDRRELLYFTKDNQIKTLEEGGDKNLPVMEWHPVVVQGIFNTLTTLATLCRHKGVQGVKEYLKANLTERANMHKFISDMLLWLFLGLLFKWLKGEYKNHLKKASDDPVLCNLATELLYKASSRSIDLYKGIVNVMLFFGENMNPPYWSVPMEAIKDGVSAITGEKSWKYLLLDNSGLTRSFRDTAIAYMKSQK